MSASNIVAFSSADEMGKQTQTVLWLYTWGYLVFPFTIMMAILITAPKTHPIRASLPSWVALNEGAEYEFVRMQITTLLILHFAYNTSYVILVMAFFHIGAVMGCVFHGLTCRLINRRVSLLIGLTFTCTMYVVFSVWSSAIMMKTLMVHDRDFYMDYNEGSRKIRPFVDPNLAKALTNEFGFYAAFSIDYQHLILLTLMCGFALSTTCVTETLLCDIWSNEGSVRICLLIHGLFVWWAGKLTGCMATVLFFVQFDIHGAFLAILFHKFLCYVVVLVSAESKGWDREVTVSGNPCYLKSLYYALYLWPQGSTHFDNMLTYMIHNRQHWGAAMGGQPTCRGMTGRLVSIYLQTALWKYLHWSTIAIMFWGGLLTPNPLNCSLMMEWFNLLRTEEGTEFYYIFISVYPAFVVMYMEIGGIPWFLSVCDSLRHVGHFLALFRWPAQLYCGDPMACWRSQYLYSHAIFYNCGGDQGNIGYVNWYLFSKSQKRQCCCPYRKLKPDAPEKCCPPCCLGPLVEETGGCPCPCCCASCSA